MGEIKWGASRNALFMYMEKLRLSRREGEYSHPFLQLLIILAVIFNFFLARTNPCQPLMQLRLLKQQCSP